MEKKYERSVISQEVCLTVICEPVPDEGSTIIKSCNNFSWKENFNSPTLPTLAWPRDLQLDHVAQSPMQPDI